jgi:hypothetical protein
MSKKASEKAEGTRCEFVFDDYTMKCIDVIQKELGISTRKDAVKVAVYQLAGRIKDGDISRSDREPKIG